MKRDIKIFENGTVKETLAQCLKEGYFPMTIEEMYDAKEKELIPKQWYDSSTIWYKGKIKKATLTQLKNIEKIYEDNGRVLFVNDSRNGLGGFSGLNSSGRFVGVKIKKSVNK